MFIIVLKVFYNKHLFIQIYIEEYVCKCLIKTPFWKVKKSLKAFYPVDRIIFGE